MNNKIKYWLFVTNEINWKTIKNKKIYGFNERGKKYLKDLSKEDFVVIYVTGNRIGGLFKIKSLISHSKVNFEYGYYPYKISLDKVRVPKEPIEIDKLVKNISIFKGMSRWGGALMGRPTRELNQRDYNYIKREMMNDH